MTECTKTFMWCQKQRNMVRVYFENLGADGVPNYAEPVAIFASEALYGDMYEVLLEVARKNNFDIVTESVEDSDIDDLF